MTLRKKKKKKTINATWSKSVAECPRKTILRITHTAKAGTREQRMPAQIELSLNASWSFESIYRG
jgi:hypothetical protein